MLSSDKYLASFVIGLASLREFLGEVLFYILSPLLSSRAKL